MNYTATAPGKLVLLGEYVVLEGAPALVAAMDCRAEARFIPHAAPDWVVQAPTLGIEAQLARQADGSVAAAAAAAAAAALPPALRFVEAVLRATAAAEGAHLPGGRLVLQTEAFFRGKDKLGLGSSAAVSCACWHVLQAAAHATPADASHAAGTPNRPAQPMHALQAVQNLHRSVQGGVGSGVDIAASIWGGITRFQWQAEAELPQVAPLQALHSIVIVPVWSGRPVPTAPMLGAFAELKTRRPSLYWQSCETLAVLANAGIEFWTLGHVSAFLTVVDQVHEALAALGERMGVAIVTPEHRAIGDVVRRAGGAYKPSGAGGGDLGVAICPSPSVARKVQARLKAHGMVPIPMACAAQGLTLARQKS